MQMHIINIDTAGYIARFNTCTLAFICKCMLLSDLQYLGCKRLDPWAPATSEVIVTNPVQASEELEGCRNSVTRTRLYPPLRFLHGTNDPMLCAPLMADQATPFEVIMTEHPGFGRSACPAWHDNVDDLAQFYLSHRSRPNSPCIS